LFLIGLFFLWKEKEKEEEEKQFSILLLELSEKDRNIKEGVKIIKERLPKLGKRIENLLLKGVPPKMLEEEKYNRRMLSLISYSVKKGLFSSKFYGRVFLLERRIREIMQSFKASLLLQKYALLFSVFLLYPFLLTRMSYFLEETDLYPFVLFYFEASFVSFLFLLLFDGLYSGFGTFLSLFSIGLFILNPLIPFLP